MGILGDRAIDLRHKLRGTYLRGVLIADHDEQRVRRLRIRALRVQLHHHQQQTENTCAKGEVCTFLRRLRGARGKAVIALWRDIAIPAVILRFPR